ncbi:MAG: PQQ-binding-like beta-propeller repeat protein [Planctomycetaceae bacterium]
MVATRTWRCLFALTFLSLTAWSAEGGDWPGWRGPTSNGVAAEGKYPVEWTAEKNVAWKVALPGSSGSSPAVWGDRIFVTCPKDGKNGLLCFDRSGKSLWEAEVGTEKPGKHKKGSGSSPSPTTDGKHVFVYYKSGDVAAYTLTGERVWHHNVQEMFGEDTLWWDLGTSPVLTQNDVVIAVMHSGPSYLVAFNKETGKQSWKQARDLGAPEEAAQAYSTPVVFQEGGQERLAVLGADHATCHDAVTGKELWRVGGLNPTQHKYFRSIAGPVVSDGIVVAPYGRGDTVTAIRLGGEGDVTKSHIAWMESSAGADVPTPIAVNGKVYVCRDKGEVICRDIATGKSLWSATTEKNRNGYSASPILADGKLYLVREDGTTTVLSAADGSQLAQNPLDEEFTVATPVFVDGQILIRTFKHLYCIGPKP